MSGTVCSSLNTYPRVTGFELDKCGAFLILLHDTQYPSMLRHYGTIRMVAGSIPDKVFGFFTIALIFPMHYGPRAGSAPNRNEYQKQKRDGVQKIVVPTGIRTPAPL
jgi:hypothetical protein